MKVIDKFLFERGVKGYCVACRKLKWFVRQRAYIAPQVSSFPITSEGKLCATCFDNIRKITLTT